MEFTNKEERKLYLTNLFDLYIRITEDRGISYGEIAAVEDLKTEKQMDNFENELITELERIKQIVESEL